MRPGGIKDSVSGLVEPNATAEKLLVFAVVLSTATKLRLPSVPVGPGEVLLVVWLTVAAARRLRGRRPLVTQGSRWFRLYWAVCLVAMAAGLLVAELLYEYQASGMAHDVAAYALVALFSVVLSSELQAESAKRLLRRYYSVVTLTLGLLLLLAVLGGPLADHLWYSTRFSGWARDPNQVAFQVAAAPFVLLHYAAERPGWHRWWLVVLAILAVVIGIYSGSDSLLAAWPLAAIVGGAALYARRFLTRSGTYWSGVARMILMPVGLTAALVLAGPTMYEAITAGAGAVFGSMNQGAVRVALWGHGIEAFMLSPLVGLGPGAHSGVFAALSAGEAHNSYIQWATNTGVVGLCAFVGLMTGLLRRTWTRGSHWFVMALVSYVVLMSFHTALRHPSLWFSLVILYVITQRAEKVKNVCGVTRDLDECMNGALFQSSRRKSC